MFCITKMYESADNRVKVFVFCVAVGIGWKEQGCIKHRDIWYTLSIFISVLSILLWPSSLFLTGVYE